MSKGRVKTRGFCILISTIAAFVPSVPAQQPTFTGLTHPFDGGYVDGVLGVSADGDVVVGYTYKPTFPEFGNRSFRWIRGIGFDNPGPSQGSVLSMAAGVSADGNVVAGDTGHAQFGDQEAWVRVGASRGHVGSPSGSDFSSLYGVSADGRVCAGFGGSQSNPNSAHAAIYDTSNDSWMTLGTIGSGVWSKAIAASADGNVVVGTVNDGSSVIYRRAFAWTPADGMQLVGGEGNLPDGNEAGALGVSADGTVIVGEDYVIGADFSSTLTAWRWTEETGFIALATDFYVGGVSPDGVVVIGTDQSSGANEPAIWDEAHGVRNLRALLEAHGLGPAMDGWSMCCATAISQSGTVYAIAGEGGDPEGFIAGWVVTLTSLDEPTRCPGDLNGDLVVDFSDLATLLANFGTMNGATPELGDMDQDQDVDIADLSLFLSAFGTTCR